MQCVVFAFKSNYTILQNDCFPKVILLLIELSTAVILKFLQQHFPLNTIL